MKTISVSGYLVLLSRYLTFKTCDSSFKTCHSLPSLDIIYSRIRNEFTTQQISLKKAGKMRVCSFGSSRANHLKFLCPRTSHYARYYSILSAGQLHFLANNNAKLPGGGQSTA